MSFVEWMEPSLILFKYHVELSTASGISELYHNEKCIIKSRNTNFAGKFHVNMLGYDVKVLEHDGMVLNFF